MIPGITAEAGYAELLQQVVPRLIETEEEAEHYTRIIDALVDQPQPLTGDQRDFIALLSLLLEVWEEGRENWPDIPPHEIVKALIEDNGLRQRDLVGPVFPTEGIAPEVLSGKRKLTYNFVQKLSAFFHASPDIFFPRD
jgi:HTH-type transcriptional regulator/antitoxin HigA